MTRPATFGDFLDAARESLHVPRAAGPPAGGEDLRHAGQSVHAAVLVLARFAQDAAGGFGTWPDKRQAPPLPWDRAAVDVASELKKAARLLSPGNPVRVNPGARPSAGLAQRVDGAAAALRTGHDLLDTHFESHPDGSRAHHTEWAAALASRAVRRALLAEVASLSRQIAADTARLAAAPGWRGAPGPRRALTAASHCLRAADSAVQAVQQDEPVPLAYCELLRAIPAAALPPRRQPGPGDNVAALCDGVIASARRIRRAAWQTASQLGSSPAITITSLRQLASASTVTSHHCDMLLGAVAGRASRHAVSTDVSWEAGRAADAAGEARAGWLAVARTLDLVTTDTRGYVSPAAREAGDLAMWTGRLAYADPQWTPANGPAHEPRTPRSLAPTLADVPRVIAAVHYALDTLEAVAGSEHDQVKQAARARRVLVPTRSLPRTDSTQPFTPAPPARVKDLLNVYRVAGLASEGAATATAGIAAHVASPSRILTTARAAAAASNRGGPSRVPPAVPAPVPAWPGPLESSMHQLGVTSPWLIQRAVALDRASTQLIMDAAAEPDNRYHGTPAMALSKSATIAAIVNDVLATGDPRAIALLQPPPPQPEAAEREP